MYIYSAIRMVGEGVVSATIGVGVLIIWGPMAILMARISGVTTLEKTRNPAARTTWHAQTPSSPAR